MADSNNDTRRSRSRDNSLSYMSQMQAQESFLALLAMLLNNAAQEQEPGFGVLYDGQNALPPILEAFRNNFPVTMATPPILGGTAPSLMDQFRTSRDYASSGSYYNTPWSGPQLSSQIQTTPSLQTGPLDQGVLQSREQLRGSLNQRIESLTNSMKGVGYGLGARGGNRIDCSGFVAKAVSAAVAGTREGVYVTDGKGTVVKASLDTRLAGEFNTTSEGQLNALLRRDLRIITQDNLRQEMRGGMVIAMDTGHKGFDAGRRFGIDHVVITYEDKNGKLWVAQSSSKEGGVNKVPAEQWLAKWEKSGAKLYAADLTEAATISVGQLPEELVAKTNPATPTVPGLKG